MADRPRHLLLGAATRPAKARRRLLVLNRLLITSDLPRISNVLSEPLLILNGGLTSLLQLAFLQFINVLNARNFIDNMRKFLLFRFSVDLIPLGSRIDHLSNIFLFLRRVHLDVAAVEIVFAHLGVVV